MPTIQKPQLPSTLGGTTGEYLSGRNIGVMKKVGALDEQQAAVAARVDAARSNTKDGILTIDELVRAADPGEPGRAPPVALFPEERAQLSPLLARLQLTAPRVAVVDPKALPPLTDGVRAAHLIEAPDAGLARSVPIASLGSDAALLELARRVQLVANADGDGATIATADVDAAMGDHRGAFTADDEKRFMTLRAAVVRSVVTSAPPAQMSPRVQVPAPGRVNQDVDTGLKHAAVRVVVETTFKETVYEPYDSYSPATATWLLERRRFLTIDAAEGTRVALLGLDNDVDRAVDGGAPLELAPGKYLVEVWRDGKRVEAAKLDVRGGLDAPIERLSLNAWFGADPATPNSVLARVANDDGSFRYELGVAAGDVAPALNRKEPPLPAGTYRCGDDATLRVWSNGALSLTTADAEWFLGCPYSRGAASATEQTYGSTSGVPTIHALYAGKGTDTPTIEIRRNGTRAVTVGLADRIS